MARSNEATRTLPGLLIDRWKNRSDIPVGQGMVYWHILLGGYPEIQNLAGIAQKRLSGFTGLHMTPVEWLHITVLIAGSTDELAENEMRGMIAKAKILLSPVPPIAISFERILYHPEAIALEVQPNHAMVPILDAAQSATRAITGRSGSINPSSSAWRPHVTLCYSTDQQPAGPIVAALGEKFSHCRISIDALSLVIQRGPERLWDWHPVGTVELQGIRS